MQQVGYNFINCANTLFDPITTVRKDGHIVKDIPWTAFTFSADAWRRIALAQMAVDILPCQASSVPCECLFSSSKHVITE